ncbi:AraC family transcriptional regulator ligand-binding domain-containing protein [Gluconacetobacter entanii]|uniref:AraC family transcriptional regulator ligand-binding domain-containing protein n=1 Tax=Gluconacetobacter entanii TaxID=108528 RepID=A0ABT3K4B8_9PROT|nr:AraC family transcriptional regulator [Gluconacetobacter entanii]MCE2579493.1 AraC family transcriptional regulator ligand-binding domain-containing protein [Komagataeibacter sp. FNDCR1]MCW4590245.1 AraC family transcriptional regulator ligand-binding domain-containing protein [Gluconacetobacter entanii]MCW4594282.1 AraC family transcriptional regulator ligand-binding domain-containing protein [Gluconacetobacter entanii]NPC89491.1 helix-turn-helix domain-containing protein [Gluconacetobacter
MHNRSDRRDRQPPAGGPSHRGSARPFVRALKFQPLLSYLENEAPPSPVLSELARQLRIPAPYDLMNLHDYVRIFEQVSLLCDIPTLGAELGRVDDFPIIRILVGEATDIGQALSILQAHSPLIQSGTTTGLDIRDDHASISYRVDYPALWPRRQDAEMSIMQVHAFIQSRAPASWRPEEIWFEHAPPGAAVLRRLREICGCPLRFNQPINRIMFDTAILSRRLPALTRQELSLRPYLRRQIDAMRGDIQPRSVLEELRAIILSCLGEQSLSITVAAERMNITERTLQRQLKRHDRTFRQVLHEVRTEQAMMMLRQGNMTIAQIALALGYEDISSFSRVFKKWTGKSPRHYSPEHEASASAT